MIRRLLKNSKGSTIIEFAICCPVLFLIVFGTLEFAMIMHISSIVEHSVHEGARLGITGSQYADLSGSSNMSREEFIKYEIEKKMGRWLYEPEDLTIKTRVLASIKGVSLSGTENDTSGSPYGKGDQTVVYEVTYKWHILTPFLRETLGTDEDGTFHIKSTVAAKNEGFCGHSSCFGT